MVTNVDTQALRNTAGIFRRQAESAASAAASTPSSISTDIWDGSNAEQVRSVLPTWQGELNNVASTLRSAAGVLDVLAANIEPELRELQRLESQLDEAISMPASMQLAHITQLPYESSFQIQLRVSTKQAEIGALISGAKAQIDNLTRNASRSRAMGFNLVRERRNHLGEVGGGIWDTVKGFGADIWGLALTFSSMGVAYDIARGRRGERQKDYAKGLAALVGGLIHRPGDTLYVVADITTMKENPAKWIGRILPDLVLTLLGAGAAGKAAKFAKGANGAGDISRSTQTIRKLGEAAAAADRAADASRLVRLRSISSKLFKGSERVGEWGNIKTIEDHYWHLKDIGIDYKAVDNADELYIKWGQDFLARAEADKLPTRIDGDRVVRVWDPETGTFAAYNSDGTIRTIYKPPRGQGYWDDQAGTDFEWD